MELNTQKEPLPEAPKYKEVFHVIKILPKKHPGDVTLVPVGTSSRDVREYVAHMKRDELLPVPASVCEALTHAAYDNWVPDVDERGRTTGMKLDGTIQRFPFQIVYRNIPKDVYEDLRKIVLGGKSLKEADIEALLYQKEKGGLPKKAN